MSVNTSLQEFVCYFNYFKRCIFDSVSANWQGDDKVLDLTMRAMKIGSAEISCVSIFFDLQLSLPLFRISPNVALRNSHIV